jgi:cell division protein FtsW
VPLHYADFIFSAVGVEGGLVATLSTVLLFTLFLCCCVYIAWHARDMFGLLVATGLTFFICLQASIHMGVVTGLLPNKGFPLPFISHGGTNLIFNLAGVGLLFSIARFGVTRVKSKNPFDRHIDVPVAEAA